MHMIMDEWLDRQPDKSKRNTLKAGGTVGLALLRRAEKPPEPKNPPDLQKVVTDELLSHYQRLKDVGLPLERFSHMEAVKYAIEAYYYAQKQIKPEQKPTSIENTVNAYRYNLYEVARILKDKLKLNGVFFMPDVLQVTTNTGFGPETAQIIQKRPVITIMGLKHEQMSYTFYGEPGNEDDVECDGIMDARPLISFGQHGQMLFMNEHSHGLQDAVLKIGPVMAEMCTVSGLPEVINGLANLTTRMRKDEHEIWGFDADSGQLITNSLSGGALAESMPNIPRPYVLSPANGTTGYDNPKDFLDSPAGTLPVSEVLQKN